MKIRLQFTRQPAPEPGARENLRGPATFAMVLHGMVLGLALFGGVFVNENHSRMWGDEGLGGGQVVPVNLMPSVPLPPQEGPDNPLASDTAERNPAEVKPAVKPPEPPPPSDKELQLADKDTQKKLKELERKMIERELKGIKPREVAENAVPGTTASGRASSSMYGMATGSGAGGIGFSGNFASLYGWYVRAVRECIARHWDQGRIDSFIRTAPKVFVEFDIVRDGSFQGERVVTSSGIPSVDREALRAVQACSGRSGVGAANEHLPALPSGYSGSSVRAEVWFEYRK